MGKLREFVAFIGQDRVANSGRSHIQLLLTLFRASQWLRSNGTTTGLIGKPVSSVYRGLALFFYGIDIPVSTQIGTGFTIHHGMGLVIHNSAVLGSNVIVRQNVTIGSRHSGRGAPIVGDQVDFGAGSMALGEVSIGKMARVGAGAVVIKSVPSGAAVVGNPARLLNDRPVGRKTTIEVPPSPADRTDGTLA